MCLYTEQTKLSVADKDIECWKILEILENRDGEEIYVTPYAFRKVEAHVLSGEVPFVPEPYNYEEIIKELEMIDYSVGIEAGFIHVYDKLTVNEMVSEIKFHTNFIGTPDPYIKNIDSKRLDCMIKASSLGYAVFKCIIPKGTEYLSGTYPGHGANACVLSMCTKSLVFKEKVMEIRDTLNKLELQHLIKKALNL